MATATIVPYKRVLPLATVVRREEAADPVIFTTKMVSKLHRSLSDSPGKLSAVQHQLIEYFLFTTTEVSKTTQT
jgi:hypothetical protein